MNLKTLVRDFYSSYFRSQMGAKFFVGFSCGIPFLLRLSVLDLWLKDNGISNTLIGLFTLIHWPYWLKFLWAPFIERMTLPFIGTKLGRRRGWAIASQCLLFLGVFGMSCCNPQTDIMILLALTSLVAFADGCQDVSLYAYQLDGIKTRTMGISASVFMFGFRIGMFFSKSITLYIAHYFNWNIAYYVMAFSILICTVCIFYIPEPKVYEDNSNQLKEISQKYLSDETSSIGYVKNRIYECLICPFQLFMQRHDWKVILMLILVYRAGDRIAQKMAKLFYIDMGFSILDIANVVQVFGTIATIIGGMIGGFYIKRVGIKLTIFHLGIVHAIACFSYVIMTYCGHNIWMLYCTVSIENITGGAIATAFIAFIYDLCNHKAYAATQYALFWGIYEAGSMIFRSCSGFLADSLGWTQFFALLPLLFIPGLLILHKMIFSRRKCLISAKNF